MTNKQEPVAVEQGEEPVAWRRHWHFREMECPHEFTGDAELARLWVGHPQTDKVVPLYTRPQPTASDEVRVRHKVRGTCYSIVGEAEVQTNHAIHEGVNLVVYRGDDGKLWCWPKPEFEDGRFEALTAQAKPQPDAAMNGGDHG